ncbi:MAG: MarR family transcriptional regulator [Planctomycetes bacterium]|nr:MarR family transcriptional regulator [Planctomycetota bacterium]
MNDIRNYRSRFVSPVHAAYRELSREFERRFTTRIESSEGHLLSYVARYGPCAVGKIADVFGIKGATLTGQLDKLEKRRLLKREVNPADRRSFLVAVTPKGRKLVNEIGEQVREIENQLMSQVSERDYKAFLRVIETIRGAVPAGDNHAQ